MMKVLGITGGVGAGKSTILAYLEKKYGARVIMADRVAFLLQQPGQRCYEEIVRSFGSGILCADGAIDRAALASVVFADREKLETLNGLVHPAVKQWITEEIQKEKETGALPFLVLEAALLLEDHYDRICDEIWYIDTDPAVRTERLKKSRGYSEEKVRQIMANQMSSGEYREKCKIVIDNSSDFVENTFEQIDKGLIAHGFLQHCEREQR